VRGHFHIHMALEVWGYDELGAEVGGLAEPSTWRIGSIWELNSIHSLFVNKFDQNYTPMQE
jgi:hypothetical protein